MKTSLHVENDLRFLPVCTSCAESFAALSVDDAARRNKIVLCVEEAFCHTVEHAYEAGETGEIVLGMSATPSGFEVTMQDHGLPFERTLLDTFDPRKALEQADVKGLGLLILQKSADQVVWENRGYEGNCMRMTFLRPVEDVTQCEGGGRAEGRGGGRGPCAGTVLHGAPRDACGCRAHRALHLPRLRLQLSE
jgi:anti-sigma regulatory factor (Ser/Thr protein kinase)